MMFWLSPVHAVLVTKWLHPGFFGLSGGLLVRGAVGAALCTFFSWM